MYKTTYDIPGMHNNNIFIIYIHTLILNIIIHDIHDSKRFDVSLFSSDYVDSTLVIRKILVAVKNIYCSSLESGYGMLNHLKVWAYHLKVCEIGRLISKPI